METRNKLKWLLLLLLTGISLALVTPNTYSNSASRWRVTKSLLCWASISSAVCAMCSRWIPPKLGGHSVRDAQARAMEVIRNRVDAMGTTEPNIQAEGDDRIIVELPNLQASDQERALDVLQSVAFLEFRMVQSTKRQIDQPTD